MNNETNRDKVPFALLLVFLFLDYIKISHVAPALGGLHLPMIVGLSLLIIVSGKIMSGSMRTGHWCPIARFQIFLCGAMMLSTATAYVKHTSYLFLKDNIKMLFLYFFIVVLVTSKEKFEKFIWMWMISILTASLIGLSYYFTGENIDNLPVGGYLSGADDFAAALNITIPFCFFFFVYAKGAKRLLLVTLLCLFATMVILLGSRGGFLGLAAVTGLILLTSPGKKIAFSLVAIGMIALITLAPPQFFSEVKSITDTNESTAHARLSMWQDGVDIFVDNPITGIGLMNFPSYHGKHYILTEQSRARTHRWRVAHSDPVTVLCELGAIGFLFYIMNIYYIVSINLGIQKTLRDDELSRSYNYLSKGLLVAFVGYFVCSLFLTLIYYPHFYILAALTTCLKTLVDTQERPVLPVEQKAKATV